MITVNRRPRQVAARLRLAGAILAVTVVAAAAVTGTVIASADPTTPSETTPDTTTPPSTSTTTTPSTTARSAAQSAGSVFANRPIPGNGLLAGARSGNQFTYWSTGADGQPHLTTGSLYLPPGAAPRGGYPVVAWAHGSRGLADDCAPSVRPTDVDVDQLRTWLSRGYAVVSTDYSGLGTPGTPQYYDLPTTAQNILDAVRASSDISDELSKAWVAVGEGQGASAAILLARNATANQGPKLDFRGSAATSIPAELAALLGNLGPSTSNLPAGLETEALYTLAAIRTAHPTVGLDDYLTAAGRTWMTKATSLCAADLTRAVGGVSLGTLFSKALSGNRELTTILNSASELPTRGFTRPVLMSQTLQDPNVVVPVTLKYLNDARVADRRVTARTYLTPDAAQAQTMADNDIRGFVARVTK
ncbi:lipase [Gordonia desulfuricans]|uniref:Lipase n=1 Tax=Gordonia desulfuricans TaxID=89051 RepID=A0A7K3LID8_9ACTN|nr:lipase family protein [Gordonia desulfuricans]NDK88026.1 lipase [Gordonia desulfuricans]